MQQDIGMLWEEILQDNVTLQDNIQANSKASGGRMGSGCAPTSSPHPRAQQEAEEAACAAAPGIKQSHK